MRARALVMLLSMLFVSTSALGNGSGSRAQRIDEPNTRTAQERRPTCKAELITGRLSRASKAEVPGLMSFQGTLTDNAGTALDTKVSMTFSIYSDSAGGIPVWTETQSGVQVSGGIFNVLLGRSTGISDTVFSDPERWLGVQVGGDPEIAPRQRIAAVGYAFQAGSDGDWTASGNDLFSAVPGNIGIGTASPVEKLHVSDNLRVDGAVQTDWLSEATDSARITLLSDLGFNNHLQLPVSYIIFTDGDSTIYALNGETGRIDYQGADAAAVIRQTVASGRKVVIRRGLYSITSPIDLDSSFTIELEPGAILEVPSAYSSYVFGLVDQGEPLCNAHIQGGTLREAPPVQRNWTAVLVKSSGNGIFFNTVRDVWVKNVGTAIELSIDQEDGWINGNEFKSIRVWWARVFIDFITSFGSDSTKGFHRNYFENIMGQTAPGITEFGAKNIRHKANMFVDVKFWDLHKAPGAVSASIHEDAENTIILGGIMTYQNFEDNGTRTQIIDPTQYAKLKSLRVDQIQIGADSLLAKLRVESDKLIMSARHNQNHLTIQQSNGDVGIGTATPEAKLHVLGPLSVGVDNSGHDVNFYGEYAGSRFLWDQEKMALRAGRDSDNTHWAPDSIGGYSFATGRNTKATGNFSTAMGSETVAGGNRSTAMGQESEALGTASTALGYRAVASGDYSCAAGFAATAGGNYSLALGRNVTADSADALVLGCGVNDANRLVNDIEGSLVVGFSDTTAALFVGGPGNLVGVGTSAPTRKFWVNGDAGGTTGWYNDSDGRLKQSIAPIENALDKVGRLKGVYFEWKDTEHRPEGLQVGLIAQEVAEVVPEVVEKKGGYYSLATAGLVPVLIEAVKEQQGIIERLQARVEALESAMR